MTLHARHGSHGPSELTRLQLENEGLRADNERLTAEVQTARNTAKINLKVAQDRGAEIERLLGTQAMTREPTAIQKALEILNRGWSAIHFCRGIDLRAEVERLTLENWQLKGALGYPVPGNIPESPFKCGLCEAKRGTDEAHY